MKDITDKIITWAGLGIAVIAAVLAIVFALNVETNSGLFDVTYWILICFVALSLCAIVAFWAVGFAKKLAEQPRYWMKVLVVLAVVVVACVAAYALAKGDDVTPAMLDKYKTSVGTSKMIGAACILVYILVIVAAVSIVVTEIVKFIKKK